MQSDICQLSACCRCVNVRTGTYYTAIALKTTIFPFQKLNSTHRFPAQVQESLAQRQANKPQAACNCKSNSAVQQATSNAPVYGKGPQTPGAARAAQSAPPCLRWTAALAARWGRCRPGSRISHPAGRTGFLGYTLCSIGPVVQLRRSSSASTSAIKKSTAIHNSNSKQPCLHLAVGGPVLRAEELEELSLGGVGVRAKQQVAAIRGGQKVVRVAPLSGHLDVQNLKQLGRHHAEEVGACGAKIGRRM